MTRSPKTPKAPKTPRNGSAAAKALGAAVKPAELVGQAVGQTLERALDPLTSVLKRAALQRADRSSRQFAGPAAPVTAGALVSPLAVPFPAIPPIAGVELATGRAGLYKQPREDVLLMRFAEGTSCAGVFTRHAVGSAPVDWCKRHLEGAGGESVRGLVVNAGCANAFTGRPGADAARRVAAAAAKRLDCRQRDVMLASTGVIGVLLDDAKISARLPEIEGRLTADGWQATGLSFKGWRWFQPPTDPSLAAAKVCRSYGAIVGGPNSHFFSAEPSECPLVDPHWFFEGPVFYARRVGQPGLTCPDGYLKVQRAYNDRARENDSNHRFSTSDSTMRDMQRFGWIYEGAVMFSCH